MNPTPLPRVADEVRVSRGNTDPRISVLALSLDTLATLVTRENGVVCVQEVVGPTVSGTQLINFPGR